MLKKARQVALSDGAEADGKAIHEAPVGISGIVNGIVAGKDLFEDVPSKLEDQLPVELELPKEVGCRPPK